MSLVRDRVLNFLRKFINLTKTFKTWNIDERKYQKMEVSKYLYFELVNFNLMLFTLGPSILFHEQLTSLFTSRIGPLWNLARLNDVTGISMLLAKIGEWLKQVTARYFYFVKPIRFWASLNFNHTKNIS